MTKKDPIYIKKILTQNEAKLYECLYELLNTKNDWELFSKVRWEDIWGVEKGHGINDVTYNRYRGFLRSRHVDFLIMNRKDMNPAILIELNDSSHDSESVIARDNRLKDYCQSTNLHIIFINTRPVYDCDIIREKLNECFKAKETIVCEY